MKSLKQVISLALSVLLVASALFIGATAETTDTVNATALEVVTYNSTRNNTVGAPVPLEWYEAEKDNKPLVPSLPSDRFTFTWSVEGNSRNSSDLVSFLQEINTNIYTLYEYQPLSLDLTKETASQLVEINGENSGFMFYISLGKTAPETVLYIENQVFGFDAEGNMPTTTDKNGATVVDKLYATTSKSGNPYYLLQAGTVNWEGKTISDRLGIGGKGSSYGITLPAGYEGFVYLPKDSYLSTTSSLDTYKYLSRTDFYVNKLSPENIVEVSNIMVVDGDVTSAKSVTVNGGEYVFNDNRFYSFDALNVNGVDVSYNGFYGFKNDEGQQLALGYGAEDSSLSVNMGADKNSVIAPDSYYTATPAAAVATATVQKDKRPTDGYGWSFFDMSASNTNGRKLYVMDYKDGFDPFASGEYLRDTTNTAKKMTYGEQYERYFNGDGSAYVGGVYQSIGINNSNATSGADSSTHATHATIIPSNFTTSDSIADKAVMFYVKHTYEDGITDKQTMNITVMLTDYCTQNGRKYYAYDIESGKWSEETFIAPQVANANNAGCISLDPSYEGWIVIPVESFANAKSAQPTTWSAFRIAPECFGGVYGELTFGDITLIDNINPLHVTDKSAFISSNDLSLSADFPFNNVAAKVEGDSLYRTSYGKITGFSVAKTGLVCTYTADPETFAPNIDENGVYKADELSRLEYQVDGANASTAGYSAFAIRVDNTKGGDLKAIVGTNYVYLNPGSDYYLMSDDEDTWKTKKTTTDTWTMKVGTTTITEKSGVSAIEIPEDFVGWLCIPFESYKSSFANMARFDFFPVTMTGSITFSNFSLFTTVAPKYYIDSENNYVGINSSFSNLVPYDPDDTKVVTVADGVLANESDALYADFKVNGSINAGEALMFYAKNDSETDISFKLNGFNMVDARVYDKNLRSWAGFGPDATTITLEAGFEGWVKIPASAASDFTSLRFIFYTLANGFAMSDFMVANQADSLDYMRRGTTYKTPLFYKTGDFNIDGNTDILDLVYNKNNSEVKFDIIKFAADDQQNALREYLLAQ